jgi:Zn-dependent M28 family amino/carboxypeptidase
LEAAEVVSRLNLQQSVLFAGVNLEENACDDPHSGLRGSSALAVLASEQGWEIEAVLVLESVGYAGAEVSQTIPAGIPVEVPETGDFIAVIGNEAGRGAVAAFCGVIERCRLPLPYLPLLVPGNGEVLPDTRRSDHAPFWDLGYPAVMLTDTTNFRSPHYHQASDTPDTLNLAFATEVCRAVVGTVMALAEAEGTAAGS